MANYSRWDAITNKRPEHAPEVRAEIEHDPALGQLIHDLRTAAGLSQRALAERMGTTQSVTRALRKAAARRTGSIPSPASPKHSTGTSSPRSPRRSQPG